MEELFPFFRDVVTDSGGREVEEVHQKKRGRQHPYDCSA